MINLITVGATGIRTKLIASTDIQNTVSDGSGNYKIFLGNAPGGGNTNENLALMPYITMHHIRGGEENVAPSRSFDMTFRVGAVHKFQPTVETIAGHISAALHEQLLTYLDGWEDWALCLQLNPYYEEAEIQGIKVWRIGAYYRIRAVIDN